MEGYPALPHNDMLSCICLNGNKTMFDWYVYAFDICQVIQSHAIESSFCSMVLSPFMNATKVLKFVNDFGVRRSCVAQLLIEYVSNQEICDFLQSLLVKTRTLSRYMSLANSNYRDKTMVNFISHQYKRQRLPFSL